MKKAKRILAGALAALILTMSLPLSALADEADVPVESPSFEVAFDVDTGQEEISEDPPADIEATPEPTRNLPQSRRRSQRRSQRLHRKVPLHRPRRQNLPQFPRLHPELLQRRQQCPRVRRSPVLYRAHPLL